MSRGSETLESFAEPVQPACRLLILLEVFLIERVDCAMGDCSNGGASRVKPGCSNGKPQLRVWGEGRHQMRGQKSPKLR